MLNPSVSFLTKDAVVNTSFYKTVVVVGQSNDADEGFYKDLELKTEAEINATFGADSHIAACLKDSLKMMSNSNIKPKLWAISYEDKSDAVARILESVVSGTATEAKTLKIKINSLNPDRVMTQFATVLALRNTKGAYCGDFSQNSVEFGAIVNARNTINPILANATTNDTIIEVEVTNGMTASQVASAINTAINASTTSIYGSSVSTNTLTITSKHKGALSNHFAFEIVPSSIPAGISFVTTEDTAGSGIVDVTGILDVEDSDSVALRDQDFNFIVLPYGYSVTALVTNAKAKFDNVLDYNNQCLEYFILRATALDFSSDTALDSLASAEPVAENGIVKLIGVLETSGLKIVGLRNSDSNKKINKTVAKQFIPIQQDNNKKITIGVCSTLSNSTGFVAFERVLAAALIREAIIERFMPRDFKEVGYTTGNNSDSVIYSRDVVKSKFEYYRDLLDGSVINDPDFGKDYNFIISNNSISRARFDELLDLSLTFDKITGQLALKLFSELLNPIKSIFIISYYN